MSMRRIVALSALGLSALCLTVFALAELLKRTETFRATLPGDVDRVVVQVDGGDVTVRAGVSPAVLLAAKQTWVLLRPDVEHRVEGRTLVVEASCDPVTAALRCSATVDLAVPPTVDVEVDARTADVHLRGLRGRVLARTETGDLETDRLEPVVFDGRTETGDADLDVVGTPTRIAAATRSGDVRVVVPYGAYRVDAQADDGEVRVDGLLRGEVVAQRLELRSGRGDIGVRAR
jgi:hypothetical protein